MHLSAKILAYISTVLLIVAPVTLHARERSWFRYDNTYFEVFSDAKENDVRELLGELENFRRFVVKLANIKVPDGAQKTQVLIFRSSRDFARTRPNPSVSAYMSVVTGIPYIVMSATKGSSTGNIIRHEYTHVLQAYSQSRQPPWYTEGFAEFAAGVTFLENQGIALLGDTTGRTVDESDLVNWDELISDDFRFHQITSTRRGNNAYVQAWLLVHYLTIGDNMAHNSDLIGYLTAYANGTSSTAAFAQVFAEAPSDLGGRILAQYKQTFSPIPLSYASENVAGEFVRTEASSESVRAAISRLKLRNGVPPD